MLEAVITSDTQATFNIVWVEEHMINSYTECKTEHINISYTYTCTYRDKCA